MRVAVLVVKDVREPYYVDPTHVISAHRNLSWPGEVYDLEIRGCPQRLTVAMSRESLFQQLGWTADRDERPEPAHGWQEGWAVSPSRFGRGDLSFCDTYEEALDEGLLWYGDDTFWLIPYTLDLAAASLQQWASRPEQVPLDGTLGENPAS